MMMKILTPRVEHRKESDLRAQVLGVGRDGAQCLARRSKQSVVDARFVLKCDGRNRLRYGEDHMEVLSVEKFGSTVLQPLSASQRLAFWAVAISIALMTRRCAVHSEAPWISR
jgi:hypothetical protein